MKKRMLLPLLVSLFILILFPMQSEACTATGLTATISEVTASHFKLTLSYTCSGCGWGDCVWRFESDPLLLDYWSYALNMYSWGYENGINNVSWQVRKNHPPGTVVTITCTGRHTIVGSYIVGNYVGEPATITIPYEVTCYQDADGDGYGNPAVSQQFLEEEDACPAGWTEDNTDCDDTDPDIAPCIVFYRDEDGDGYGVSSDSRCLCEPEGYYTAPEGGDPDDQDGSVTPGSGDEKNLGEGDNTETDVGEPVNVTIGNAYSIKQDFFIPDRGLHLFLERAYNSRQDYEGPFGYGWTHNYNMTLTIFPEDILKLMDEDGTSHSFFSNGDGTYAPEFGNGDIITENPDSTYTYQRKDGTRFQFNNNGRLTEIIDRNANNLVFAYNPAGNLISVADDAGRTITFTYDSNNRISAVKGPATSQNPSGTLATYTYDTFGNLIQVTYPDGSNLYYQYSDPYDPHNLTSTTDNARKLLVAHEYDDQDRAIVTYSEGDLWKLDISYDSDSQTTVTDALGNGKVFTFKDINGLNVIENIHHQSDDSTSESFTWNERANKTGATDRNGHTTTMTYDTNGNLLTKTDPLGNTTTYTYEPNYNNIQTIIGPNGNITTFNYDSLGNVLSIIDPLGNTTTFQYDAHGQMTSKTDANGNTTTYEYDGYGNLTKMTNSLGHVILYTYDALGNRLSVTDANGNTTLYQYNTMNRLVQITYPDGSTTGYQYDARGNIISLTDAKGTTTTFAYDVLDNLTRLSDPYGNKIIYTYDEMGNRIQQEIFDPDQNLISFTTYQYNVDGKLIQIEDAEGDADTYAYDPVGNRISSTDGNGHTTTYTYDANHRMIASTDPKNQTTHYEYDSLGNLTRLTDAKGDMTSFAYDALSRVVGKNAPDTGLTNYTYDPVGNLMTKRDAAGEVTTYQYDALNRLIHTGFSDPNQDIQYIYDTGTNGIGKLSEMKAPSSITTYQYNTLGQVMTETNEIDSKSIAMHYQYDENGNILEMTYPSGRKIGYAYDLNNRIVNITSQTGGTTDPVIGSAAYLPFGPITSYNHGNGLTTQMDYYQNFSIKNIQINPLSIHRTYGYDAAQNVTWIDINNPSLQTFDYAYDSINQLTSADGSWGNLLFSYDNMGNRTTKTADAGVTDYAYTANKISAISGITSDHFTHNAKGNLTSNDRFQYMYDLNNRLTSIQNVSQTIADYTYDGEGKRVKKQVGDEDTYYLYDQQGHLISEIKGNDYMDYIYMGDMLVARGESTTDQTSYDMHLPTGWSMISLPVADDASVSSLFPDAVVVYGYNSNKGYFRAKEDDALQPGKGYWILLDQDQTYTLTGRPIPSYTLPLDGAGWAMIGGCTSGARPTTDSCNIVVIYKYVQGAGYQRVLESEDLQPGEGYWILWSDVGSQCELRVDTTGSLAKLATEESSDTNSDYILFYHLDHLNTPILMTDQDGTIVWEAEYSPFGKAIIDEDPDGDGKLVMNNLRFPGQYYDTESGLYYNMMRYYNPDTGRYLTPDPIGFTGGGLNLYRYVGNNPVNLVDPWGLCGEKDLEKLENLRDKYWDLYKANLDMTIMLEEHLSDAEKYRRLGNILYGLMSGISISTTAMGAEGLASIDVASWLALDSKFLASISVGQQFWNSKYAKLELEERIMRAEEDAHIYFELYRRKAEEIAVITGETENLSDYNYIPINSPLPNGVIGFYQPK